MRCYAVFNVEQADGLTLERRDDDRDTVPEWEVAGVEVFRQSPLARLPRFLPGRGAVPDLLGQLAGKLCVIVLLVPRRPVTRRLLLSPSHRSTPWSTAARGSAAS